MPEKPLLIFPSATVAQRIKAGQGFSDKSYNFPDFVTQKDRLTSQFQSMKQSFITDSSEGLEPEKVLVIETYGQIENFQRAIRHVPGLEWLAEIDKELDSDEYFYKKCLISSWWITKHKYILKNGNFQLKKACKIW